MDNIINSGSLEALTPGNSLLVQSRQVANGKIQLEIAERLEGAAQANPLAALTSLMIDSLKGSSSCLAHL